MFVIATAAALAILGFALFANWRRAHTPFEFQLQPNCLLTRYPLLFVSGPRSLLYFADYWNQIPQFLSSHGYEVIELQLPWRNRRQRQEALREFLRNAERDGRKVHVIGDASCELELQSLLRDPASVIQSCTTVAPTLVETTAPRTPRVDELRPPESGLKTVHLPTPQLLTANPSWIATVLMQIHNWISRPEKSLDPVTLAVPSISNRLAVAHHYLNLAISLAESDLKCSH